MQSTWPFVSERERETLNSGAVVVALGENWRFLLTISVCCESLDCRDPWPTSLASIVLLKFNLNLQGHVLYTSERIFLSAARSNRKEQEE